MNESKDSGYKYPRKATQSVTSPFSQLEKSFHSDLESLINSSPKKKNNSHPINSSTMRGVSESRP